MTKEEDALFDNKKGDYLQLKETGDLRWAKDTKFYQHKTTGDYFVEIIKNFPDDATLKKEMIQADARKAHPSTNITSDESFDLGKIYKLLQSVNNGCIHKKKYFANGDDDIRPANTTVYQNDVYKLMDKLVAANPLDAYQQLLLGQRADFNLSPELYQQLIDQKPIPAVDAEKNDVWCNAYQTVRAALLSSDPSFYKPDGTVDATAINDSLNEIAVKYNPSLAKLLGSMLALNPAQRLTYTQVSEQINQNLYLLQNAQSNPGTAGYSTASAPVGYAASPAPTSNSTSSAPMEQTATPTSTGQSPGTTSSEDHTQPAPTEHQPAPTPTETQHPPQPAARPPPPPIAVKAGLPKSIPPPSAAYQAPQQPQYPTYSPQMPPLATYPYSAPSYPPYPQNLPAISAQYGAPASGYANPAMDNYVAQTLAKSEALRAKYAGQGPYSIY